MKIFGRKPSPARPVVTLPVLRNPALDAARAQIADTLKTATEQIDSSIERLRAWLAENESKGDTP